MHRFGCTQNHSSSIRAHVRLREREERRVAAEREWKKRFTVTIDTVRHRQGRITSATMMARSAHYYRCGSHISIE